MCSRRLGPATSTRGLNDTGRADPVGIGTPGRRSRRRGLRGAEPVAERAEFAVPGGVEAASDVGAEEQVERLVEVAEGVDPPLDGLEAGDAVLLGERGAGDGQGLGLDRQVVGGALAFQ